MRVILATDGSQDAEEAARLLAHLPHSDKLEVTVVYVSNTVRLQGAILPAELMKQHAIDERERAEKNFRHLIEVFDGANVSLELAVLEGHVDQAIVCNAETRKIELIVKLSIPDFGLRVSECKHDVMGSSLWRASERSRYPSGFPSRNGAPGSCWPFWCCCSWRRLAPMRFSMRHRGN